MADELADTLNLFKFIQTVGLCGYPQCAGGVKADGLTGVTCEFAVVEFYAVCAQVHHGGIVRVVCAQAGGVPG